MLAIGIPYIPGWDELRPFVADLWLVATAVAVLLTPFFARRPNRACGLVTLVGLTLAEQEEVSCVCVTDTVRPAMVSCAVRGWSVAV
jgi:hypothetical protein